MHTINPIDNFTIHPSDIRYVGSDLQRPECILAEADGVLWAADARGGVVRIAPDGTQTFIGPRADERFASNHSAVLQDMEVKYTQGTLPNGLAFDAQGRILIANFGNDTLERMSRQGEIQTLIDKVDGRPIGKVNFVLRDSRNRIWLTVSTCQNPWTQALMSRVSDGYVAVIEAGRLRIVAEGFYFTNEVRLDAKEEWLYIVETTGPRITRMRLDESDPVGVRLTDREIYGPSDLGGFPDGMAFDAHGNLWCTLVMVDRLVAITPQGTLKVLLEDGDPLASAALMDKFRAGTLTLEDLYQTHGEIAPWMASVTFGGPDLKTVYLGSLRGSRIPCFRSPVPGLPLVHWGQACEGVSV